jgi:hypothetical protein
MFRERTGTSCTRYGGMVKVSTTYPLANSLNVAYLLQHPGFRVPPAQDGKGGVSRLQHPPDFSDCLARIQK